MELRTGNGTVFYIDAEDWESEFECQINTHVWCKASPQDLVWYEYKKPHTSYLKASLRGSTHVALHRLLMGATQGEIVDHIDRNGLNNFRTNLRMVSQSQNQWNRSPNKNHRFKGVSRYGRRWAAKLKVNYKRVHLGTFDSPEEAAAAYDQAALEHFGEFACLNFPQEATA